MSELERRGVTPPPIPLEARSGIAKDVSEEVEEMFSGITTDKSTEEVGDEPIFDIEELVRKYEAQEAQEAQQKINKAIEDRIGSFEDLDVMGKAAAVLEMGKMISGGEISADDLEKVSKLMEREGRIDSGVYKAVQEVLGSKEVALGKAEKKQLTEEEKRQLKVQEEVRRKKEDEELKRKADLEKLRARLQITAQNVEQIGLAKKKSLLTEGVNSFDMQHDRERAVEAIKQAADLIKGKDAAAVQDLVNSGEVHDMTLRRLWESLASNDVDTGLEGEDLNQAIESLNQVI